jgi:hypothetical protein
MKYTYKNGVTIDGTKDQIIAVGKTFGELISFIGYYESASKGLIKISDMDSSHIKNVIKKEMKGKLDRINVRQDDISFIRDLVNLPNDELIKNLFDELTTRV